MNKCKHKSALIKSLKRVAFRVGKHSDDTESKRVDITAVKGMSVQLGYQVIDGEGIVSQQRRRKCNNTTWKY